MNELISVTIGALFGVGVYLLLQRSIVFLVIGFGLISHAVNLMLLVSGRFQRGAAPILQRAGVSPAGMVDPLPQALILTAIVIGFGISAFLLGLALKNARVLGQDDLDHLKEDPL